MTTPFVRQLGSQPGVQLNPTVDQTDGLSQSNQDEVFAVVGRFLRGRIDRAFVVDRSTIRSKLGAGEAVRLSALNECYEQVVEALSNGAYQAVVSRLTTSAAVNKYAVFTVTSAAALAGTSWSLSTTAASGTNAISILHLDCYNDGIIYEIHADPATDPATGLPAASTEVSLYAYDPATGQRILDVSGSLLPNAVDDYGVSRFLPDLVAQRSDAFVVTVNNGTTIPTDSPAYGVDSSGADVVSRSGTLIAFTEGGTGYVAADYTAAIEDLRKADIDFGYLISGGTQAPALIQKLAAFAYETNRHLKADISGSLTPAAAIAAAASLSINSEFVTLFWAPLLADAPTGNGRYVIGTAGLSVGYSCARNAARDANGFAAKNYPIAGPNYPINRTNIRQIYTPTQQELSLLADAKIIPVIYDRFNGGGRYVFSDVLTSKGVRNSLLKLSSVAEMKSDLDDAVARQAKELVNLPIAVFIRRMSLYLEALLTGAQAAGWLVPSKNLDGNAAFAYDVSRSNVSFADTVLITYYTSYDGVARQVQVTQVLTR